MNKVLIIGDSCQDIFRYGICERLCPEAPVPVFKPIKTVSNGGMSLNVFENLKALGVYCDLITNNIRPTKTRYVDEISNQLLLRVDENDKIKQITAKELRNINFNQYSAIIISDYNKGYLDEENIKYITNNHSLVFMDTKKKINEWALDVEIIKINEKEFNENNEWLAKYYNGDLVITLGHNGAQHWFHHIPIEKEHEVRDLSGAGDTFLAALVADYIKNNDICNAIRFANSCAAWVVSQKGVAVVKLNKL